MLSIAVSLLAVALSLRQSGRADYRYQLAAAGAQADGVALAAATRLTDAFGQTRRFLDHAALMLGSDGRNGGEGAAAMVGQLAADLPLVRGVAVLDGAGGLARGFGAADWAAAETVRRAVVAAHRARPGPEILFIRLGAGVVPAVLSRALVGSGGSSGGSPDGFVVAALDLEGVRGMADVAVPADQRRLMVFADDGSELIRDGGPAVGTSGLIHAERRLAGYSVLVAVDVPTAPIDARWRRRAWHDGLRVGVLGLLLAVLAGVHIRQQGRARRDLKERVRARTEELALVNSRLLAAERIAGLGHWERDLETGEGFWSAENFRIYGLAPGPAAPDEEAFLARVHPKDRDMVRRMREAARTGGDPYDLRFRVVAPDGGIRFVHSQAEVERDAAGRARRLIGTTLDVTAVAEAERRLRESEEMYRTVFEVARDGLYLVDQGSHTILEANRAARRIYGYSLEEFRALTITDLSAEPDKTREAMRSGLPLVPLRRHRRKDGTEFYIELMSARARIGSGSVLVMAVRDITERVAAEARLEVAKTRLTEAERIAHLGHWEWLPDSDGHFWSEELFRILGVSQALLRPGWDALLDRVHPDDRAALAALPGSLGRSGEVGATEVRAVRPDGEERHLQLTLRVTRDDGGRMTSLFGTVLDVTERKRIEDDLRVLTRAIEQVPLSVVITDLQGVIEYVNPHFTKATGYPAAEAIGQNPRVLKSGYSTSRDYQGLWRTIAAGEVWHGEFHNRRRDGQLFWERASIAPVRDERGVVTHYVAVKEDITERKRAELELLSAKERAEAASVAKSQFLGTVSHELRTPLNAIIGFSECMKEEAFGPIGDPRYRRFAGSVHEAGEHLLKLINDIIDLANAGSGRYDISETIVDPRLEVAAAVDLAGEAAARGGLTLEADVPEHLPLLYADERAIRMIVGNLLSNAIKFTPAGGRVAVRVRLEDSGLFLLRVEDTGIGIPADKLTQVLEPFSQLDGDFTREHEGTGLGLTLCRSMAEMHGGHLEIESAVGAGTTVTVRFPRDRVLLPGQELSVLAPGLTG